MAPKMMSCRTVVIVGLLAVFSAIVTAIPCASGTLPTLVVRVSDTTAAANSTSTVSVYMSNYQDTVAGFNLWLQLDRPDLMAYVTSVDTVIDTTRWFCQEYSGPNCTESLLVVGDTLYFQCNEWDPGLQHCLDSTLVPRDSILYAGWDYDFFYPAVWNFMHIDTIEQLIGTFDTTGTLVRGWEWVDARSLSGFGTDLNVAGIADLPGGGHKAGIAPQQGGVLIKLQSQVLDVSDTVIDRTVNIMIQSDFLSHFNFSRPDGSSIGLAYQEVPDTNCWICQAWAGDICITWRRVSIPPPGGCDSVSYSMDTLVYVDTAHVWLTNGSLTVLGIQCGDVDGNGAGPDISDLVYIVQYMFGGGPAPTALWAADFDCNHSQVDISDLVYLVQYMFGGGPWCKCGPW